MEKQCPSGVPAHKLDQPALNSVKQDEHGEYLATEALTARQPNQNQEIQEFRASFVELRRMERNMQGRADHFCGARTGECHAPGQPSRLAEAATCGETAQPANRMAQRQAGRITVHQR